MPFHEVLPAQDLDSSVAEFILSQAEGLFRNGMGRFEIDSTGDTGELPERRFLPD